MCVWGVAEGKKGESNRKKIGRWKRKKMGRKHLKKKNETTTERERERKRAVFHLHFFFFTWFGFQCLTIRRKQHSQTTMTKWRTKSDCIICGWRRKTKPNSKASKTKSPPPALFSRCDRFFSCTFFDDFGFVIISAPAAVLRDYNRKLYNSVFSLAVVCFCLARRESYAVFLLSLAPPFHGAHLLGET